MSLRIGKCWQGTAPFIIFQAETQLNSGERWRGYLSVDLRTRPGKIQLTEQKPEDLLAAGAISNLIRKHTAGGKLLAIYEHLESGDYWLPLHSGELHFFQMTKVSPPEFRVLTPSSTLQPGDSAKSKYTVIARLSSNGMFTKKYDFHGAVPVVPIPNSALNSEYIDILPEMITALGANKKILLEGLEKTLDQDNHEDGKASDASPLPLYQREARDRLARRLKTLRKSLKQSHIKTPDKDLSKDSEQKAHLLKTFSWLIKPGMDQLKLDPIQTGLTDSVTIDIDPDLSLGAQIDALFVQTKRNRKGLGVGAERIRRLEKQIDDLNSDVEQLRGEKVSAEIVTTLLIKHQLAKKSSVRTIADVKSKVSPRSNSVWSKFRSFKATTGVELFVGRSAAENDELTKAAKSNDWWFHVVGIPGSHVIVPAKTVGTVLPPDVLREAGILALHFSKYKENRAGEVHVTQKQNLRKQKGMPAGMWTVIRSETVFIRYEQDDLDRLFKGPDSIDSANFPASTEGKQK